MIVLQTRHWYEQQMAGLGDAFADSLVEIVNRVEMMPQMYPVTRHNVRRGKLRRFPYLIYYRIQTDQIEVVAVLHGSRHPNVWRDRVS